MVQINIKRYVTFLIGVLSMSCNDTVDLPPLSAPNEAVIAGIDSIYQVLPGGRLQIKANVSFTKDPAADPSRYRYEWFRLQKVGYIGPGEDYRSVGMSPVLDLEMPASRDQGAYDFMLRVTDLQTNLFTEKEFRVFVANDIYEGWILLGEKQGEATLDMLSYRLQQERYEHIANPQWKYHATGALKGKPLFVRFGIGSVFGYYNGYLAVGTSEEAIAFGSDEFSRENELAGTSDLYEYLPTAGSVDFSRVFFDGSLNSMFIYVDGNLFVDSYGTSLPSFRKIADFMDADGTLRPVRLSSRFAVSNRYSTEQTAVVYDEQAKEFLWMKAEDAYVNELYPGRLFDFKTGQELLYVGYTEREGGQYVALLQDTDGGDTYLARFSMYDQRYYEKINVPLIDEAEQVALSTTTGELYYSVGSRLFVIDEAAKESRPVLDVGGATISVIKFNSFVTTVRSYSPFFPWLTTAGGARYKILQDQLVVCTYDPLAPDDSGIFRLFTVDPQAGALVETYRYEGFPKIVDVTYKER